MDRLVIKPDIRSRLADSIETASGLTGVIADGTDEDDAIFGMENYLSSAAE